MKCEECGFESSRGKDFVMFQGEVLLCADESACKARQAPVDSQPNPQLD